MSSHVQANRMSIPAIEQRKGAGTLVVLTAYSTPMAR